MIIFLHMWAFWYTGGLRRTADSRCRVASKYHHKPPTSVGNNPPYFPGIPFPLLAVASLERAAGIFMVLVIIDE